MNLATLKKEAKSFTWNLCNHSWINESKPGFLGPREVAILQSNGIKFSNGAWLFWPKASECCFFMSSGNLCFSIQLDPINEPKAHMVYELIKKEGVSL